MGKNFQHQETGISLDSNPPPGCIWGILHHFHRTKWLSVKKRLPHRRLGGGSKHGSGEMQQKTDAKTENSTAGKAADSGSVSKSVRCRLKALIIDEVHKRRGQHHRSTSCPSPTEAQLTRTTSIHRLDPSDVDISGKTSLTHKTSEHNDTVHSSAASLLDPILPRIGEDNVMSKQESKLFPGALDLLDIRKEVFLKILHGRSSSFTHQLHGRLASKKPEGLAKSVSFPSAGSLLREAFMAQEIERFAKSENKSRAETPPQSVATPDLCREGSVTKRLLTNPELFDNVPPDLTGEHKNKHDSKHGVKSFKNLREKIRHALKESKKEKHRIVMDAVLDKVPHGQRMSKDAKEANDKHEELDTKYRRFTPKGPGTSPFNSPYTQSIKRHASFNDFADRYNRLLESCFKQKVKHHTSERQSYGALGTPSSSTAAPKALERILSLPDLRCSSEDSIYASSSNTPFSNTLNMSSEQKHLDTLVGSENLNQSEDTSDESPQGNFQNDGDTFGDFSGLQTQESPVPYSNNIKCTASSDSILDKPTQISSPDIDLQYTTEPSEFSMNEGDSFDDQENISKTENISTAEDSINGEKGLEDMLMHIEVYNSNKAAFDYTKCVLELSGLCRGEFLEKWHSAEMPLNPAVFDEVEQCFLMESECSENEHGGIYDHLLLFNSINEALLEIYEKSFSYWPNPLTCRSCIRRMPVGYRILEDVWGNISWLLRQNHSLNDPVSCDLAKGDNWMNLQFEAECVGLELEDLILDDLLDELLYDDLLLF